MTKSLVFLGVLCAILIGVCGWQARELAARKRQAIRTEAALQDERQLRAEQDKASQYLERRERDWQEKAMQLTALVGSLRSSEGAHASNYARVSQTPTPGATNDPAGSPGGMFGKGMGEMLAKMMKDPNMREVMRAQQKVAVKKMYGPMIADLNLPPEQAQKLNDLLLDQQMKTLERSQDMFKDGAIDFKKIGELSKDAEKGNDTAIQDLLGPEKFAEFQEYKKTMAERMQLGQFKEQMQEAGSPIADHQAKQMLAIMAEERDRYPMASDPKTDPAAYFANGGVERQIEWQEEVNRRVNERLAEILSADQLKAYVASQEQQLSMQKFGIKMMREMFGKGTLPPVGTAIQLTPPIEK